MQAATTHASMYWGATISAEPYGQTGGAPYNTEAWDLFERHAGKRVAIVNIGAAWGEFNTAAMEAIHNRGAIPLVTMPLEGASLEQVAAGQEDAKIESWAKQAKAWGYPFFLNPWWEMNGDWYPWGRSPQFVPAWRHFHDVVAKVGATNVTWTWTTNNLWHSPQSDPKPYYPGDSYVDWIGIDGYNWGLNPAQPIVWSPEEEVLGEILDVVGEIQEIEPGNADRPIAIIENASSEVGGNKPDWIREALGTFLPDRHEIAAYIWFNWNFEKDGLRQDWQIESSAAAQQAFRSQIQSSFFRAAPALPKLTKVPPPPAPSGGSASQSADLSTPDREALAPQLAVAPDGGNVVVWSAEDEGTFTVFGRRIAADGTRAPTERLSALGEDALDPEVAVDPEGNATVVWVRSDGSNFVVQARRIAADGSLGSTQALSVTGRDAADPNVAVGPDGTATVVWRRYDGSRFLVKERQIEPDGTVEAADAKTLSAGGADAVEQRVAVAPDGTATIVWSRYESSGARIQVERIEPDGTRAGTPQNLSPEGGAAIEPAVAVDGDGAATVSWIRSDGSHSIVQARRLSAKGTPDAQPQDLSASGGSAAEPQVAAGPGGNATVVWDRHDGSSFVVQARRLPVAGSPGPTRTLSASGRDAAEPQVAVGPSGVATVIWTRFDGSAFVVQKRVLAADGTPEAGVHDLSQAGRTASAPQVGIAADGTPVAVWRRFNGAVDVVQTDFLPVPRAKSSLTPASHDFGSAVVGSDPAHFDQFSLENTGKAPLLVSGVSVAGPDGTQFTLGPTASCTDAEIAPGSSCDLSVAFTPLAAGAREATLLVESNSATGPDSVELSGTGVPAPNRPTDTSTESAAAPASFTIGRPILNTRRGTAKLPVTISAPGTVLLTRSRHDEQDGGLCRHGRC